MKEEKIKSESFLLGETIVTDIIWKQSSNGFSPQVKFQPLVGANIGKNPK